MCFSLEYIGTYLRKQITPGLTKYVSTFPWFAENNAVGSVGITNCLDLKQKAKDASFLKDN